MITDLIKNVRLKIALLFLIPSLGLLYFAAQDVYDKYQSFRQLRQLEQTVDYIAATSKLVQQLQRERGLSILYLGSSDKERFQQELQHQRTLSDQRLKAYDSILFSHESWRNEENVRSLLSHLKKLPLYRKQIDERALPSLAVLEYYSRLIDLAFESVKGLQPLFEDPRLHRKISDLMLLLSMTEFAGQERALVAEILDEKERLSDALENHLLNLESDYDKLLKSFDAEADLQDMQLYLHHLDSTLQQTLQSSRREIIYAHRYDRMDPKEWWELASRHIDALFQVESEILHSIQKIRQERKEQTLSTLFWSLAFWGLFIVLLSLLFFRIVRIVQHFGERLNHSEEKRRLYRAYSEFSEYLIVEHSVETLYNTLANLLYKSELFPMLWLSQREENGKLSPLVSEGLPLALIRQELAKEDPLIDDFHEAMELACRNEAYRIIEVAPYGPRLFSGLEAIGIFPISYDSRCRALLILGATDLNELDRECLDLMHSICRRLGTAIEHNSRLFEERKIEEELRIAATAFNAQEAITITDAQGEILQVNDAFTRITGYTSEEAVGKNPSILQSGKHDKEFYNEMWDSIRKDGYWKGEIYNRRKNGEIYPEMLSISSVKGEQGRITHYVAHFFDISEVKEAQKTAEYRAQHDPLTDLYNRQKLMDELEHLYRHSLKEGEFNAFLFLDMDNFKHINDYHNHEIGDKVLIEVGRRLQTLLHGEDLLARIAGDEFAMILTFLGKEKNTAVKKVSIVVARIKELFASPLPIDGHSIDVSFSIGIKLFPDSEKEWKEVMINADVAMYHAKKKGKNHYNFFNAKIDEESKRFLRMKNDFSRALKERELCLHYQPRISKEGLRIVGIEALLRWYRPDGTLLMPDDFLFVTQGNHLGYELTEYVLDESCRQIEAWLERYPDFNLSVSINLSGEQFDNRSYMKQLLKSVAQKATEVRNLLEFEIVEDALVNKLDYTIGIIQEFRDLGIDFSIDDFGTGYSSINYLKRLPVDSLKIDREFILDLFEEKNDEIVKMIINTAKVFGMRTVAEGVEDEKTLRFLEEAGCDCFQGFYFAKALPVEELESEWFSKKWGDR